MRGGGTKWVHWEFIWRTSKNILRGPVDGIPDAHCDSNKCESKARRIDRSLALEILSLSHGGRNKRHRRLTHDLNKRASRNRLSRTVTATATVTCIDSYSLLVQKFIVTEIIEQNRTKNRKDTCTIQHVSATDQSDSSAGSPEGSSPWSARYPT